MDVRGKFFYYESGKMLEQAAQRGCKNVPSPKVFKARLDGALGNLVWY